MSLLQRYRDRARERWPRIWQSLKVTSLISAVLLVFVCILFFHRIFISIQAGHSGVLWRRFFAGTDLQHVYGEGFHIIAPWDVMTIYDQRIQQVPHQFVALSKDGLPITVDLSIRYRPIAGELPMLHKNIGPDYVEKVVKPEVQAMVRFVFAQYSPEEIYTSEGFLLNIVTQGVLGQVLERHILLDDLLIKRLTLPEPVRAAIEAKLVQQQTVQSYKYRLLSEEQEANRKRVEAAGIRDFELEVTKGGAFEQYLRFQGIGATVQLASSTNAKVVVVGGSNGLPLIMNLPDSPLPAPAAPGNAVGPANPPRPSAGLATPVPVPPATDSPRETPVKGQ